MTIQNNLNAAIAATRFGLGARAGEIDAARGDPRGFLLAQIRDSGADPTRQTPATSAQRMAAYFAFKAARSTDKQDGPQAKVETKKDRGQLRDDASNDFMDRLHTHARELLALEEKLVLAGDFNVIPAPEDVYDPRAWAGDALFLPETRKRFRALINLGFTDALRATTDAPKMYTFWDYTGGAWQRNNGLRIDHLLLSPQAADRLVVCDIDKTPRGREKASDHTPVWVELS